MRVQKLSQSEIYEYLYIRILRIKEMDDEKLDRLQLKPRISRQWLLRKTPRRLISKRGNLKVHLVNQPNKYLRYSIDYANTLVGLRWRWVILLVILINSSFYLFGSSFWTLDAWLSGDHNITKPETERCIRGTSDFTGYLMLSIESITTTGYGYLYPTEHCKFAWVTLTVSTVLMILLDGALISVLFLKICKPVNDRVSIFSKKCLICMRNGKLCMVFRVNDFTGKHAMDTSVNLYLLKHNVYGEESGSAYVMELKIEPFGLMMWPTEIIHYIDNISPLYDLSPKEMVATRFEFILVLSGASSSTGQQSVSRTSYLPHEVLWGHKFIPCMEYNRRDGTFIVNVNKFNQTIVAEIALCSAKQLEDFKTQVLEN